MLELRRAYNALDKWWQLSERQASALFAEVEKAAKKIQDDIFRLEHQEELHEP